MRVAVGIGVAVGILVAGIMVTIGGGKLAVGSDGVEEQAARRIKNSRIMHRFMKRLYQTHLLTVIADVFKYSLCDNIFRKTQYARRHFFFDEGFSTIGTDLRGHMIDYQLKFAALQGNGCKSIDEFSLSANDTIHKKKPFQISGAQISAAMAED